MFLIGRQTKRNPRSLKASHESTRGLHQIVNGADISPMRDSIVKKLKAILSERVDSEYKVVYILTETRKLLDVNSPDPRTFRIEDVLPLGAPR